jgi:hypothetical protein
VGLIDRLLGRPVQPAPAEPTLVCSGCFTACSGTAAHVIPWWNETLGDFVTTYRCDRCWLGSLGETKDKVQSWDAGTRDKFCEFLERHRLSEIARQVREASLPEASRLAVVFLNLLRGGEHRLLP